MPTPKEEDAFDYVEELPDHGFENLLELEAIRESIEDSTPRAPIMSEIDRRVPSDEEIKQLASKHQAPCV